MGHLIDGVWSREWYDTKSTGGRFVRPASPFRDRIEPGGRFAPAPGRYHLYVSWACPWSHRTLIYRAIKGLEEQIGLTIVDPLMLDDGWTMAAGDDPVNGARTVWQLYAKAQPKFTGRCTVPVLWDRETGTIVNNESSDIVRMFDAWPGASGRTMRPAELAAEIDVLNEDIYANVNNGVYRAGFATGQGAYDEAFGQVFAALDRLDARLATRPFLCGDRVTEADWRLFVTLVRFDAVYHGHFKCNRNRLADMPELWDYTRALYQAPGVAATVRMDHIKRHYYGSHRMINPTGIVPLGPAIDFAARTRRRPPAL